MELFTLNQVINSLTIIKEQKGGDIPVLVALELPDSVYMDRVSGIDFGNITIDKPDEDSTDNNANVIIISNSNSFKDLDKIDTATTEDEEEENEEEKENE